MLCKDSFQPHHWPSFPDHCASDLQAITTKKGKKLSFYISCAPISIFSSFFSLTMAIQGDIKENSGLSLLLALWICQWLKGKWLSLLIDCTFSPETCNKVIELENQEQNRNLVNNISVKFLSLFVILKMEAGENVTLLNRSFCLSFAFQSSVILQEATVSFVSSL